MADEMSVSLPEGVLKPIIQAQIVSALQGQERLVREMVEFVLKQQVQDKNYNRMPFLELVSRELIKEAVEGSVREWIGTQKDALTKLVAQQLRAQAQGIASRLVGAVADEATSKWRLTVNVKLGERD